MAQVRWTPQAVDDLEAICLFIARDAPSVAAVFASEHSISLIAWRISPSQAESCLR
jgi:plasmid stabilization system protein ParE